MKVQAESTRTLLHPDPVVQEVLDIWTGRFLASQIPLGDLTATASRIGDWTQWGTEWMETASVHERLGQEAWDDGRRVSTVAAFLMAARCYHVAYFLTVHDEDLHRRGMEKMLECHDGMLDYMRPAVEKIRIPFQDTNLVALLSLPAGTGPFPLVFLLPGLDSTKETRHFGRGHLLQRGMAVLSLDGPGQGEMSLQMPLRHDYEVAVGAAIDHLDKRDDIDTDRLGLIGSSLGGYYACRVAAFEPRLKAVVANCGPYDWAEVYDDLPEVTRGAFRHYSWSKTEEEAKKRAADLNLEGVAEQIRQPLVVVHGMLDPLIPVEHSRRIAAEAADATLIEVDKGVHGANNYSYRWSPWVNDWLAGHLGGAVA